MKTTFSLILILALSLPCYLKAQDQISPPPLASVSGYGFVTVQPDEVEVEITIMLRDQNVDTLTDLINNRSSAVMTILHDANVTDQDIESSKVSMWPYYSGSSSPFSSPLPDYYQGKKSLTFTLKNASNYESLMANLSDAGINSVDSVVFQLSKDLLQSKELEAQKNAAANLKEVLDTLAEGVGFEIGKAYTVNQYTYGGDPQAYYGYSTSHAVAQAGEVVISYEGGGSSHSASEPSFLPEDFIITSVIEAQYYIG